MFGQKRKSEGRRQKKNWLRIAVFSCFLLLFVFSASKILKSVTENRKAENSYAELQTAVRQDAYSAAASDPGAAKPQAEKVPVSETAAESQPAVPRQKISMNFSALKEISPDIIGWLRAEGTNIDYPITQTDNNEYYLNHLYNGEWNSNGTIFVDYRNAGNFSDRNTIIYGHHMKNAAMFCALEEYKDQEFYDSNPTMMLFTPEGDYVIELICGTVESGDDQFVEFTFDSDDAFLEYTEKFRARSTFISNVELQPGDRIVSLCTCSYEWSNARYMIIGRLLPIADTEAAGTEPT